ncbi:MAG: ATP-binding protein, partial [Patescibacteria group bacterium]
QPLEDKVITVARARATLNFPAQIMLIAAMNPCPCGHLNSAKQCVCSASAIERYKRKISGPIIDRIDIWLGVYSIAHHKLEDDSPSDAKRESSDVIQKRVEMARKIQEKRLAGSQIRTNAEMSVRDIKKYCALDAESKSILQQAAARLDLSPRAYHRVIKLARTIADLANAPDIKKEHLLEALQYRPVQQ